MNRLEQFREGIWTLFQPLSYFGMKLGTRSTIVQLPSGALVIISPVTFDEATKAEIDALGVVDYVIAPNLFHHLFFNQACALWPEAQHLVPPGLSEKVSLIGSTQELSLGGLPPLAENRGPSTDKRACLCFQAFSGADHHRSGISPSKSRPVVAADRHGDARGLQPIWAQPH